MEAQTNVQEKTEKRLKVSVSYNGMEAEFEYAQQQTVRSVRMQALNHWDIRGGAREENFLFGPDNQTELSDEADMGSQVQPGTRLYLRPRSAGGGSRL